MQLAREALKKLIKESIRNLSRSQIDETDTALEKAVAAGGGDPEKPTTPGGKPEGEEAITKAVGSGASQANSFIQKLKPLIASGSAKSDYKRVMALDTVGRINALALFGDEVLGIPKEELIANLSKLGTAARGQKSEP